MENEKWIELQNCKPNKLSDEKLNEYMDAIWITIAGSGSMRSGDVYAALLSEKTSRQNRVTVRWSLSFSILAVAFALFSLIFSAIDWNGDKAWQTKQIQELKNQNIYLEQITNIAQQLNTAEKQGGGALEN